MTSYQNILFDLDGTLTDSGPGVTNSVAYALDKFGICIKDKSELHKFIGPPLHDSFEKFHNFSKADAIKAVEYYREYYHKKGVYENRIYEGIEDLLRLLSKNNKTLIVATSKHEYYANKVLEHLNISKYFSFIAGSNDGTRVKKDEVISYALDKLSICDKEKTIMIGDREYDITGANVLGLDSIGVLFGYGSREELEKAGAKYIVASVSDIGKLILG